MFGKIFSGLVCAFIPSREMRESVRRSIRNRLFERYRVPNKFSKNVLITLWYASGFHGGVVYAAELSKILQSLGYNVNIACVILNKRIFGLFKESGANLYYADEIPLDVEYDVVWAFNFPILPFLIFHGLKYKKIIFNSLSGFLEIDVPVFFYKDINRVLVLSELHKKGFGVKYGIRQDIMTVFPNIILDEYYKKQKEPGHLRNIAVVSNHLVPEVKKALKLLRKRGYKTVIYGAKHNYVHITPEILLKEDVVITIGKTVQYCLALGIPIYNYDHFGGVGYITPSNVEEMADNFSGSPTTDLPHKSAECIADEIIDGFEEAKKHLGELKKFAQKYNGQKNVVDILDVVNNDGKYPDIKVTAKNRLFFNYCNFIIKEVFRGKR